MVGVVVLRARGKGRDGEKHRRGNQLHKIGWIFPVRTHGLSRGVPFSQKRAFATFDDRECGLEPRECLDADVPVFSGTRRVRSPGAGSDVPAEPSAYASPAEAGVSRAHYGLRAAVNVEFAQDGGNVVAHRLFAHAEFGGDARVVKSARDLLQNLPFA